MKLLVLSSALIVATSGFFLDMSPTTDNGCESHKKKKDCRNAGCEYIKKAKLCNPENDTKICNKVTDMSLCRKYVDAGIDCKIDSLNQSCHDSSYVVPSLAEVLQEAIGKYFEDNPIENTDNGGDSGEDLAVITDTLENAIDRIEKLEALEEQGQSNNNSGGSLPSLENDDNPRDFFPFNYPATSSDDELFDYPTHNQCKVLEMTQSVFGESSVDKFTATKCSCKYDINAGPAIEEKKSEFGRGVSTDLYNECTCRLTMDIECIFDDLIKKFGRDLDGNQVYHTYDQLPNGTKRQFRQKAGNTKWSRWLKDSKCFTNFCNKDAPWLKAGEGFTSLSTENSTYGAEDQYYYDTPFSYYAHWEEEYY